MDDDDLRAAVADDTTVSGVIRALGHAPSGGMHRYVRQPALTLDLDTSHFVGRSWAKGRRGDRRARPLAEVLVERSDHTTRPDCGNGSSPQGCATPRCAICGIDSWLGRVLRLQLDHINGDHTDNRLDNLRILCPNCHAQTTGWCGRRASEPA